MSEKKSGHGEFGGAAEQNMDKINELKEMIVDLKMESVKTKVPIGHCPYSYFTNMPKRKFNCSIGCEKCREFFLQDMKEIIKHEVENL